MSRAYAKVLVTCLVLMAGMIGFTSPQVASSSHGEGLCNLSQGDQYDYETETVYVTYDTGADGGDTQEEAQIEYTDEDGDTERCHVQNIDASHLDYSADQLTPLEVAAIAVEPEGEIIVEEHPELKQGGDGPGYAGGYLGTQDEAGTDGVLRDPKSFTIRGEEGSISVITGNEYGSRGSGEQVPFVFSDNDHKKIEIKNLILAQGTRASLIQSRSNVEFEDVSIDATIESTQNSDVHFKFDATQSGAEIPTGSVLKTSNMYYPSDSPNIQGGENTLRDTNVPFGDIPGQGVDDYVFIRENSPADSDPVLTGNLDRTDGPSVGSIYVDSQNGNDEKIEKPFKTVDAAVKAADRDQVVEVKDRGDNYERAEFTGLGVSEQHRVTVMGYDTDGDGQPEDVPTIEGFDISYPGMYNLENLHISSPVEVKTTTADLELSGNYWDNGITDAEDIMDTFVSGESESDIINVSPFCEDENCNDLTYDSLDGICLKVNDEGNCQGGGDVDLDISLDVEAEEDGEDPPVTDVRNSSVTLNPSGDIDSPVRVQVSILETNSNTDYSTTVQPGRETRIVDSFDAAFSNMRANSVSASPKFKPTAVVSVEKLSDADFDQVVYTRDLEESITLTSLGSFDPAQIFTSSTESQNNESVVVDDNLEGLVERQNTKVTRFSAGVTGKDFLDNRIPPLGDLGTEDTSVGTVEDFGQLRSGSDSFPAIVQPQLDATDSQLNVGFSFEDLPPASEHYLKFEYAYEASDTSENDIEINLVDDSGDVIYSGRDSQSELLESTASPDAFDTGQPQRSDVTNRTKNIALHPLETQYIQNNEDIYLTLSNDQFQQSGDFVPRLFVYNATITSTDNVNNDTDLDSISDDSGNGIVNEPIPGDINVEVAVSGNLDGQYDTYDVDPVNGENIQYELIFENQGDSQVAGEFAVKDTLVVNSGQYPDNQAERTGEETRTMQEISVDMAEGETVTRQFSTDWGPDDFGFHEVRVTREDIDTVDQGDVGYDAYVLQPPTPEIVNISIPNEHVTHDNFNTEIVIQNIGDLSGQIRVNSNLSPIGDTAQSSWSVDEVHELPEGDSRAEQSSENVSIFYARSNHPSTSVPFNRREYTVPSEVIAGGEEFETEQQLQYGDGANTYYRPNAPFSTSKGTNRLNVEVESEYDDSGRGLSHSDFQEIYLGKLKITDFSVDLNPTEGVQTGNKPAAEEATVYASAWPYLHPSEPSSVLRPYGNSAPDVIAEGTMFSQRDGSLGRGADTGDLPVSRGAFPLNREEPTRIRYTSEPVDRYLSTYFSTHLRACSQNQNALFDGETQLPIDEASESDVADTFIAFSSEGCGATPASPGQRLTEVHGMRFVGTTQFNRTDTRFLDDDSGGRYNLDEHPSDRVLNGTNPNSFRELDERETVMFANVRMVNPVDTEYITTARLEIVTDQSSSQVVGLGGPEGHTVAIGSDRFDDNVVGAAAVRLRPEEEIQFRVPIVIRNNEDADGVHELQLRPRVQSSSTEDSGVDLSGNDEYIEFDPQVSSNDPVRSPITGEQHDRFTVPIKVETYGDAILNNMRLTDDLSHDSSTGNDNLVADAADKYAYSVCRSDPTDSNDTREYMDGTFLSDQGTYSNSLVEGLNPRSGINDHSNRPDNDNYVEGLGVERSIGECRDGHDEEDEKVVVEATYTNYGGDSIAIRPQLLAEFQSERHHTALHRQNAHATGDRFFADYRSDGDSDFNAKTWSSRRVNGNPLPEGNSVTIDPGETVDIEFERRFQEPGLYNLRVSPCRKVSGEGPQHYNLEGFTGIPDYTDHLRISEDARQWTTARHGIDRLDNEGVGHTRYNEHSTPEIENSLYHGSRGCSAESVAVFVYDSQKPVADFRIGNSDSTAKEVGDSERTRAKVVDQTANDGVEANEAHDTINNGNSPEFEIHEGGTLFFDGSTYDCDRCYDRDHFSPDLGLMETPEEDPNQETFRSEIKEDGSVFSHRMSTASTRITGDYDNTHNYRSLTDGTGLTWQISGENPNFGQESDTEFCEQVDQSELDEHCYMEAFEPVQQGEAGMEVVAHRFTNPSVDHEVELTVQDDPTLTRGEAHTNTTRTEVEVVEDNEDPNVETDHSLYNDLDYDAENQATSGSTLWHRENDIFDNVNYRSAPTNFENDYGDDYEGTRMCVDVQESNTGDNQIGISQDAWWQIVDGSREILDEQGSTLVTDDGSYLERSGNSFNPDDEDQFDKTETRHGDKRCWAFGEEGPNGAEERQQEFEYQVWDFAENDNHDEEIVNVESDTNAPSIDTFDDDYRSETGNGGTDQWIWAYNPSVGSGFAGGDVRFDIEATDNGGGVGIACLDLRLNVGSGPSYGGEDIHGNCQSMGDERTRSPSHEGTHGNQASDGASYTWVGTDSAPGLDSSNGYFAAEELQDNYDLDGGSNSGDDTYTVTEELHAVDWHGNHADDTIDVTVKEDGTAPDWDSGNFDSGTTDHGQVGNDTDPQDSDKTTQVCGGFESDGPDGGIAVYDYSVGNVNGDGDIDSSSGPSFTDRDFDDEVCVTFEYSDDFGSRGKEGLSPDPDPSSCSQCESGDNCDTDCDDDTDTFTTSGNVDVTIEDLHGNTATATFEYDATIDDFEKACNEECNDCDPAGCCDSEEGC